MGLLLSVYPVYEGSFQEIGEICLSCHQYDFICKQSLIATCPDAQQSVKI